MADFLENEAIESSGSDEEDFLESAKRKKEQKKRHYESSEDESEDGKCHFELECCFEGHSLIQATKPIFPKKTKNKSTI